MRAIDYYNKKISPDGLQVIILDASDEGNWSLIAEEIRIRKYPLALRVLHHSPACMLSNRVAEALTLISTPYVLLAADDDLYFFDWLESAVDLLDSDTSYGIVYAHTLKFELERYTAYGDKVRVSISDKRNPPARWLEGSTPLERLSELGRSDWATVGWYALQRTEILKLIVDTAEQNAIDGYHFEKLLVFCQAALSRTRMLDCIYLARQVNRDEIRPPYSFKAERAGLGKLMDVSATILSQHMNIAKHSAVRVVENVFRGEISQLKKADSRKYLRAAADYFPGLRGAWRGLRRLTERAGFRSQQFSPDARFPSSPEMYSEHPMVMNIKHVVSNKHPGISDAV